MKGDCVMKKNLANIITGSRTVMAIILFTFKEISTPFLIIYLLCGITDLIDGPIARKTNNTSELGAKLDSLGDTLTYLAMGKVVIFIHVISVKTAIWFLIPLTAMLASGFISKIKFHSFILTHTVSSKIFGGGCFLIPFAIHLSTLSVHIVLLWLVGMVCAFEMLAIQITATVPSPDTKSLYQMKKAKIK